MPRKRKHLRKRVARPVTHNTGFLRRIAAPALGWLVLGIGVTVFSRPERIEAILSGELDWWRIMLFLFAALAMSLSVAALSDWNRRRKK